MIGAKEIFYGNEARLKMMAGVDKTANAVKVTLGPKGRNVIIDKLYSAPRITKDGVTVARDIYLKDNFENMGAQLLKQVAIKTAETAGDGTTTAMVLAQAIAQEGMKALEEGFNPMGLKRGIDAAVDCVIEYLKSQAKPITTSEQIAQIGTISANGEKNIGDLLAQAFEKVGVDGIITLEEGQTAQTELEMKEGMQIDSGFISPYFMNQPEKGRVELLNPLIFFSETGYSHISALKPVLEAYFLIANTTQQPLLMICHDVNGSCLAQLITNYQNKAIQVCAVKAPALGLARKQILEDIAILTEGTVFALEHGKTLEKSFKPAHFGKADRVIITSTQTTIVHQPDSPEAVQKRCDQIRNAISVCPPDQVGDLKERLAKLSTGIAVIRVGGSTEVEIKERKDRVEDAMYSTRAALEEGILPGGGISLFRSQFCFTNFPLNESECRGYDIVRRALKAPYNQIHENAASHNILSINHRDEFSQGHNADDDTHTDMIEAGIIDPLKVVRTALKDAASIASLLLTTECMISATDNVQDALTQRSQNIQMTMPM